MLPRLTSSSSSLNDDSFCQVPCVPSCLSFSTSDKTALVHALLTVKGSHILRKSCSIPKPTHNFPRKTFCSISSLHRTCPSSTGMMIRLRKSVLSCRIFCTMLFRSCLTPSSMHPETRITQIASFLFEILVTLLATTKTSSKQIVVTLSHSVNSEHFLIAGVNHVQIQPSTRCDLPRDADASADNGWLVDCRYETM